MCDEKNGIRVHIHVSDNRETMSDAENSWLPVDAVLLDDVSNDRRRGCVTSKAICEHVHMSDNREPLCDAENISVALSMSTIGRRCVAVKAVCVHVHVSDNRETYV